MLNAVQRFFAYHMIETYGCDYSTSGLSFDTLHSKLKAFLELRTVDGPRHDTYVLYYSGHTHGTGEWALAGKVTIGNFTFVKIYQLWKSILYTETLNFQNSHFFTFQFTKYNIRLFSFL